MKFTCGPSNPGKDSRISLLNWCKRCCMPNFPAPTIHFLFLFIQGETKVTSHLIFGINAPSTAQQARISLDPPSPYARQIPLHVHPSKCTPSSLREAFRFLDHIKTTTDPVIVGKNRIDNPTRTTSSTVGGGGLEWGGWLEFVD